MPKQRLYIAIFCSVIAIWVVTGLGCMSHKTIRKDCWDIAVERCLPCIQAGYECEIWLGSLPTTPVHAESCIVVGGGRIWLKDIGLYSILLNPNYKPKFNPIYKFSFQEFLEVMIIPD